MASKKIAKKKPSKDEISKEDSAKIHEEFLRLVEVMRHNTDLLMGGFQIDLENFIKKNKMKYKVDTEINMGLSWKVV